MRASALAAGLFALAACSNPHATDSAADLNAAAAQAQGDIDTYAANRLAAAAPLPKQPVPSLPKKATVSPPPPTVPVGDDPGAAVKVARAYFDDIAAKRTGLADDRWERAAAAWPIDRQLARYAHFDAQVGTPGRVDAGAGQRYIDIPVRIAGTLRGNGQPLRLEGVATLHRSADVDGATIEQRGWRIQSLELSPVQLAAERLGAKGDCAGATRVSRRDDAPGAPRTVWYRAKGSPITRSRDDDAGALPCGVDS